MLNEPATLASVARLIGETLRDDYGVDPQPLYERATIDTSKFLQPGARILFAKMNQLWRDAVATTGDQDFGFKVGGRVAPSDFFVLGHAWLASETLLGALRRLCRLRKVVSTVRDDLDVVEHANGYALVSKGALRESGVHIAAQDAGSMALLKMCDSVCTPEIRPLSVNLAKDRGRATTNFDELMGCPVSFSGTDEIWVFAASDLEAKLTGSIPDVAEASDKIAADYISSLDEGAVAHDVRQALLQLLPSGKVGQESVAARLHRSRSTLQRQLGAEGTSYRDVLESTRQALAEKYLANEDYTQAQVAFMVGFSDQSNFARAFKRWTGLSPGEFQKTA
jgi:AraC-like DNA-binding protein